MKKLTLIAILFFFASCSNNDGTVNPYKGNWNGNLNGDMTGTWSGTVAGNGKFNGTVIPENSSSSHNYVLSGNVNPDGNLTATMKNAAYNITIDFSGNFDEASADGIWIFDGTGMEGTWSGTKQ